MKLIFWGVIIISSVFFVACKDDESLIGRDFIDGDLVVKYDTITDVQVSTHFYPDTITIYSGVTTGLIGKYDDPVFGLHSASSLFDFVPESNTVDFGDNPREATLKLQLQYISYYGTTDTASADISFKVYKLFDTIRGVSGNATVGGFNQFEPANYVNFDDVIGEAVYNVLDTNIIEIELDEEYAQLFLDTSIYENDTIFQTAIHGLYIEGDFEGQKGSILGFNYATLSSYLELSFVNDSISNDTSIASASLRFYIGSAEGDIGTHRFNYFTHDYEAGEISSYMSSEASFDNENPEYFFLQAMRGLEFKIDCDISQGEWFERSDEVIINSAILKLNVSEELELETELQYNPPSTISVVELDESRGGTDIYVIPDYITSAGSAAQSIDTSDNSYNVVLSRLIHEKNVEAQNEFRILGRVAQPTITANRAVLCGSGHSVDSLRPKIIIVYTEINN